MSQGQLGAVKIIAAGFHRAVRHLRNAGERKRCIGHYCGTSTHIYTLSSVKTSVPYRKMMQTNFYFLFTAVIGFTSFSQKSKY